MRPQASLHLSTGEHFTGELIGAPLRASGEMVFTTAMVGYSESLSDPSYFGQILVFAYPLIGNYGIPAQLESLGRLFPRGLESAKVHASAVIVTSDCLEAFHWNSRQSLHQWLVDQNVPGIVGLDTRHLVQYIRNHPRLLGQVIPDEQSASIQCQSDSSNPLVLGTYYDPGEHNIIKEVSTSERRVLGKGSTRIAVLDCGVKWNIIRQLLELDCEVEILPWDTDFKDVDCQGWLLSNGPGNPEQTDTLIGRVQELLSQTRPILGICLGHQILSLAAGAKTERMPYGHRSHNQPVYLVGSHKGYITSQNHGYVVSEQSLPGDWEVWFRDVNDETLEGIRHKEKPFRSVQFHPESAAGPQDTGWILKQFVSEVKRHATQH